MNKAVWIFLLALLIFRIYQQSNIGYEGKTIRVSANVLGDPQVFYGKQNIDLSGLKTSLPLNYEIFYGDYVTLEGVYRQGILENPKIMKIERNNSFLIVIRQEVLELFRTSIAVPYSNLLAGMVLGVKDNLPQDFSQNLIKTGTSHVVVASGMNVSLTAGFLLALCLNFNKRRNAILLSLAGIWIYAAIAGPQAPIIRAVIMASAAFVAELTGRVKSTLRIFFLTATSMLIVNPSWISDVGFLLSFSTTLSLILFESKVNSKLYFVPKFIKEDLSTSIAAQILSMPIIFWKFGRVSVLSPLINAVVLWTVAPVTILGFVASLVGLITPLFGHIVIMFCYPMLWWFVSVVDLFGKIT